jgi:hypothetical protein
MRSLPLAIYATDGRQQASLKTRMRGSCAEGRITLVRRSPRLPSSLRLGYESRILVVE